MKLKNIKPAIIIFSLLIVGSFSLFAMAQESSMDARAVFKDSDKDGLSDDEEKVYETDPNNADSDADGYSDGVEVRSGYAPLKPAPGDKIVPIEVATVLGESTDSSQDEANVTNKLSAKLIEFIDENKGKTGEISVDNLDTIIQEAIGPELTEEALPEIAESVIKIKKQEYSSLSAEERAKREKEDAMNYLTSTLYIMVSNAPTKISSTDDVNSFTEQIMSQASSLLSGSLGSMTFFDDLADRGKLIVEQLNEVEVPEKLVPIHKKGLQLAKYSIEFKGKMKIDLSDPMGLVVNLSKVQKVVEQSASFYLDVLAEFKKYGISNETATATTTTIPATTAPLTTSATNDPVATSGTTTSETTSVVQ